MHAWHRSTSYHLSSSSYHLSSSSYHLSSSCHRPHIAVPPPSLTHRHRLRHFWLKMTEGTRSAGKDATLLALTLKPVVSGRGRSFVVYNESDKVTQARTEPKSIQAAHGILAVLHEIQPNLAFTRCTWTTAISDLHHAFRDNDDWKVADEHLQDYLKTMTCRCL